MIVKMKKLTILCTPAQQEQTLKTLRELKVVHVEHVQAPEGSELDQARNHLLYVKRAKEVLEAQPEADPTGKDPHHLVDTVWKLIHKEKELQETLQALEHEHERTTEYRLYPCYWSLPLFFRLAAALAWWQDGASS